MKRGLIVGTAALAIVAGSQALAQAVSVEITPEQRTTIREYVVKQKVEPVTVQEEVRVGVALPATVELRPVPSAWGPQIVKYRYAYVGDQVVLVEPSSRKVVEIIE